MPSYQNNTFDNIVYRNSTYYGTAAYLRSSVTNQANSWEPVSGENVISSLTKVTTNYVLVNTSYFVTCSELYEPQVNMFVEIKNSIENSYGTYTNYSLGFSNYDKNIWDRFVGARLNLLVATNYQQQGEVRGYTLIPSVIGINEVELRFNGVDKMTNGIEFLIASNDPNVTSSTRFELTLPCAVTSTMICSNTLKETATCDVTHGYKFLTYSQVKSETNRNNITTLSYVVDKNGNRLDSTFVAYKGVSIVSSEFDTIDSISKAYTLRLNSNLAFPRIFTVSSIPGQRYTTSSFTERAEV